MLKKIAIGLAAIVAIILAMAAMQPNSFNVKRTIAIKAPADKIVPLISDFHQWATWSPWEHLDPNMQRHFSGAASGVGAIYEWEGNSATGQGRMEVTGVNVPASVTIKLDFIKPIEGHNNTEFTLATQGDTTAVTWTMTGPATFMSKIMGVFVSMDSMVGKDFEKGLANMKAVAEK